MWSCCNCPRVNLARGASSLGVALALLVLILGYRTWRGHRAKDPLSNLGPGLYQPQKQSGDTLPLPPAPPKK